MLQRKTLQPRKLYPARSSFRIEGERESFTDKQKLEEFITAKLALQEMLVGWWWWDELGDWDSLMYTNMYKIDN